MALSQLYKKQTQEIVKLRKEIADVRANAIVEEVLASEQFQLMTSLGTDNMRESINIILDKYTSAQLSPINDFLDTLRCKGLKDAYIRRYVHQLYSTYCTDFDAPQETNVTYEEMLSDVADFVKIHPEIYNTIVNQSVSDIEGEIGKNSGKF